MDAGRHYTRKSDTMTDLNVLGNIGELTKPATVLIEKISDAIGGIFRPGQIRRVADADAHALRVTGAAKIEISDLERRAIQRFASEEANKQSNIESITQKALPRLKPDAETEKVERDWIVDFFDKCRLISDEEMQHLWAEVLAGEGNSPGQFSKRTVSVLASLDKKDAMAFGTLCRFTGTLERVMHFVL